MRSGNAVTGMPERRGRHQTAASLLLFASYFLLKSVCEGFLPATNRHNVVFGGITTGSRSSGNVLFSVGEDLLREEIARKNSDVENEGQYAMTDGEGAAVYSSSESESSKTLEIGDEIGGGIDARELVRLTKERAYPLFLLEKGLQIAEDIVGSISSKATSTTTETSNLEESVNGKVKDSKKSKEKVVVLGTGWGAAAFLKSVDTSKFDVTVISPRNFFLFTPMLAGASVGTVDYRSITEPVREINPHVNYLEATATEIMLAGDDNKGGSVQCESVVCEGNSCEIEDFEVSYDRLVLAVGAQTNTFGIKGVREYCCFLKSVEDARRIRTALINCFERANLPTTTEERRRSVLTFAVIGAGPTGVEFASELRDFVEQDVPKYYPHLLKYVKILVIEASSGILAPFEKSLQLEAARRLTRATQLPEPLNTAEDVNEYLSSSKENINGNVLTELLLESGVSEVGEDCIILQNGRTIPYGIAVWAAGVGPLPITLQCIETLSALPNGRQAQKQSQARGRVAVDPWLRAVGAEGQIFSLGDCAYCATPLSEESKDSSDAPPLPATAQVASQQGEYLARLLERCDDLEGGVSPFSSNAQTPAPPQRSSTLPRKLSETVTAFATNNYRYAAPFQFWNLGILAYTGGGSALAQLQVTNNKSVKSKGTVGFGLWRSVYLSKQVSTRNRFLVAIDWFKAQVFGRDITRA